MANIEKTVFISYRRKDISWALLIYKNLSENGFDVFFDYSSIASGDFEQIIVGNIKARAHFLVLLTPTALDRCSEPGDWLRREIETAVDEKRNIIPLFFEGFNFGAPSISKKLTGSMARIKKYNGLDVPIGYFDEAMERIRNRYLNVTLDAVLHPIPVEVQKATDDQKIAANEAILQGEEFEKNVSLETFQGVDIFLEETGPKKIELIKEIRRLTGLGLADAKLLSETIGGILMSNLDRDLAMDAKLKFEKTGAKVRMIESGTIPKIKVVLRETGPKKIAVIKVIRQLTNMGLVDAKKMSETPNATILSIYDINYATEIKQKFEKVGAIVEVVQS